MAGGFDGNNFLSTCEIYTPDTGEWSDAASMVSGRSGHTATSLSNGKVLVIGGGFETSLTNSCEIFSY
ncbi:MAG: kelch repeat-containing protein [bacterium]